jgi:UDP-N-acetylmuramyl pentapeptide phosphotransferase/UDP-N-acetylglucosamine-1-phosphate transferase
MITLASGFVFSFFLTALIVRWASLFGDASLDHDLRGVQKNHIIAVPRVGGIAIVCATSMTFVAGAIFGINPRGEPMLLLACAAPALLSGVAEDLTKRVRPRTRLLCAMAAALAAAFALHAVIGRVDLPVIDGCLRFAPFAIGLTILTVAGLTHAVNIIDGFNGLSSGVAILVFASIGYVGHDVGDWLVMSVSLTMIGAIGGFMVWNFPGASIFLGDGGAYFIGFVMSEMLVVLIARHPQVSAWYAVVVVYPAFETLFSIYRRRFVRGRPASEPDGIHLHTLVYRRIARHGADPSLALIGIVPASFFWHSPVILFASAGVFVCAYVTLYVLLVRFKVPRWLFVGQHHPIEADKTPTEQTPHQ